MILLAESEERVCASPMSGWVVCPDCLGACGGYSDQPGPDAHIMPGYVWEICERCQGQGGWFTVADNKDEVV